MAVEMVPTAPARHSTTRLMNHLSSNACILHRAQPTIDKGIWLRRKCRGLGFTGKATRKRVLLDEAYKILAEVDKAARKAITAQETEKPVPKEFEPGNVIFLVWSVKQKLKERKRPAKRLCAAQIKSLLAWEDK